MEVNFLSTKEGLTEIRDMLLTNTVPTVVHTVIAPAPNIGVGPQKTSFLQLLGLTSNISIGNIEILSDTLLIKIETVGTSEAELVRTPFSSELIIQQGRSLPMAMSTTGKCLPSQRKLDVYFLEAAHDAD
ncbi:hypothetical protein U0070_019588 [Myodes glareolus]|uniref:Large ribosomal subunit protein uL10 n=1 Tax=Myodes glareolus TaxID=447135 RepID=A0AAW0JLE2_MYOGA